MSKEGTLHLTYWREYLDPEDGYEYFNLSNIKISPNNKFAAYSIDTLSRRLYTIRIKNLQR